MTRAGHATCEIVELSPSERIAEMLMMGLRLREGISEQAFRDESGSTFAEVLDRRALDDLIAGEFLDYDVIQADRGTLRATAAGRLVLNAVLAKLLA